MSDTEQPRCPFDPAVMTSSDDPYAAWGRLRRESSAFYSPEADVWLITRHADVDAAFKDAERFSSKDWFAPMVEYPVQVREILEDGWSRIELMKQNFINLDPPRHTPIRRVVNKAFTRSVIRDRDPQIREVADTLVDGFTGVGRVDLVARFAYLFPAIVVFDILGIPPEDRDQHLRWGQQTATLLGGTAPLDELVEAAHGFVEYQRYWEEALEDRRRNPRDDLLTSFIQELDADPRVTISLRDLTITVLGTSTAGHSTTAQTICFAVVHLLTHPEQLQAARSDPTLVENAIEEVLRYDPPLQMLRRTALEDLEVDGVTIPKGATVMLACASANHDEDQFTGDPDAFDIERPDAKDHLTFGKGAHFCPGAPLARREVAIAVEVLFERLPNLRLAGENPLDRMRHFWHRGFERLELEWDPAEPPTARG